MVGVRMVMPTGKPELADTVRPTVPVVSGTSARGAKVTVCEALAIMPSIAALIATLPAESVTLIV